MVYGREPRGKTTTQREEAERGLGATRTTSVRPDPWSSCRSCGDRGLRVLQQGTGDAQLVRVPGAVGLVRPRREVQDRDQLPVEFVRPATRVAGAPSGGK